MTVKQNSLQSAFVFLPKAGLLAALWFSCTAAVAQPALPQAIDAATKLQLVAGAGLHDGTYAAGVEITMPAGAHTYWKMPGDAGVPPVFAFTGSQNVASAQVLFPAPRRIVEDGLEAFGYTDRVVFPVIVTPADAVKPSVLHVDVNYAVCSKICIPEHGTASIALRRNGSGKADGDDAALVDAALGAVPRPATPAQRAELAIMPVTGSAKPTWTLTWTRADAPRDIFADAPEGFYFATRRSGPTSWTLVAAQTVQAPGINPVTVSLTLARPRNSLVIDEKLDTTTATR